MELSIERDILYLTFFKVFFKRLKVKALGSLLGFQLGSVLPLALNKSMGIALYSMFLAILTPELKKSFKMVGIVATSGILNIMIHQLKIVPMGWHIILLTTMIWTFIDKKNSVCKEESYE